MPSPLGRASEKLLNIKTVRFKGTKFDKYNKKNRID